VPHEDLSVLKASIDERVQPEETEALYIAIRDLNELDRMIVTLHLDGYENEEISEISGLTKNNVAVKLHRIKETLTKKMKAY
jgi:RNA polymerase sigma-70 factor (ECF subfamily)